MKETKRYQYKTGQRVTLDEIYLIQGLGPQGDDDRWWRFDKDDDEDDYETGDEVIITRDVKITTIVDIKGSPAKKEGE